MPALFANPRYKCTEKKELKMAKSKKVDITCCTWNHKGITSQLRISCILYPTCILCKSITSEALELNLGAMKNARKWQSQVCLTWQALSRILVSRCFLVELVASECKIFDIISQNTVSDSKLSKEKETKMCFASISSFALIFWERISFTVEEIWRERIKTIC